MTTPTSNPTQPIHRLEVEEDVGRIWPPPKPYLLNFWAPLRWCAFLSSSDVPGYGHAFVVANAWTRSGAVKKARALWFEHIRIEVGEPCSILCLFVPGGTKEGER